jgi:hypothetical protein
MLIKNSMGKEMNVKKFAANSAHIEPGCMYAYSQDIAKLENSPDYDNIWMYYCIEHNGQNRLVPLHDDEHGLLSMEDTTIIQKIEAEIHLVKLL